MAVATTVVAKKKKARKQSKPWWKWTKRISILLVTLFCIAGSLGVVMWKEELDAARAKVINIDSLMDDLDRPPSKIFSADGKLLYEISAENRSPVTYEKIPVHVRNAILAAEDKRFFQHSGIDAWAIGRVLFTNVKGGGAVQGGSTLTMQLAKLFYTNGEKSFKRKLGDMAMAKTMEERLTKEQIFQLYANKVFFGSGAHGIQAAARVYFGKTIDQLTIGEAALLSRCVRRPSFQNPFRNPELAIENRDVVLKIMLDEKMITQDEYTKAKAEKYDFKHRKTGESEKFYRSEYFVWHVLETLKREHPEIELSSGGYKIYTTLDTTMQSVAEAAVKETIKNYRRQGVTTGAFVSIDSNGRILCEVGGLDFHKDQFNVVTDGYRQPGSSFKPFIYAAAFATGAANINDSISNEKFAYPLGGGRFWTPKNSGRTGGTPSLQTAFKMSMNIPMARVMEKTGPRTALGFVRGSFAFKSPYLKGNPSMCLGAEEVTPLDMAQAYSTFMLRGSRVKPYCIERILNPDGTPYVLNEPKITPGALDQGVADQIDALLRLVVQSGTGTRAGVVPNARGKTGTTSDNKDAWFCGYTDGVIGIGWIANEVKENGKSVYKAMSSRTFGGTVTVTMWTKVMKYAQKRYGKEIERPALSSILRGSGGGEDIGDDDVPEDNPVPDEEPPVETEPDGGPIQLPGQPASLPPGTTTGGGDGTQGGAVPPLTGPGQTPPPNTNPPTTKPPVKPPVDPPREERYESVEICADTGMRASIYCPETVTRRFIRGQEPRKKCTAHGGEHR